jgi:FtsH-binding integral membrane protein
MGTNSPVRQAAPPARTSAFALKGLKLFAIALGCFLVLLTVAFLSVKTGITVPKRWFGLCIWTGLLVFFVLRRYKKHLKQTKFWLIFLGFLLIHLLAFILILRWYPNWGLGWFVPIFIVEAPFVVLAFEFLLQKNLHEDIELHP